MNPALRRASVLGVTVVAMLAVSAPAMADDVSQVLDDARSATYTATRLTVSVWGGETQLARERVEHAGGAEMILVDETWSMVGNGRAVVMGETPSGLAFMADSAPLGTGKYTLGEPSAIDHMKRRCTLVPILEDGDVRAHMIVDNRTGAPLITYVYDGEGRNFRTTSLSDFAPHRTYEWPQDGTEMEYEIVMHGDSAVLPEVGAGYELVDAFPGPAGSLQGFYSDGLFSFSLFEFPRGTIVEGFEHTSTFVTESGAFDAVPTAKDVRVRWLTSDRYMVLVGDLPPDHLAEVLSQLPAPSNQGMFSRLWRSLFG